MEEFKINSKFAYNTRAEDRNRIILMLPNEQEFDRRRNRYKCLFNFLTSRILFSRGKGNSVRGTYEDTQTVGKQFDYVRRLCSFSAELKQPVIPRLPTGRCSRNVNVMGKKPVTTSIISLAY